MAFSGDLLLLLNAIQNHLRPAEQEAEHHFQRYCSWKVSLAPKVQALHTATVVPSASVSRKSVRAKRKNTSASKSAQTSHSDKENSVPNINNSSSSSFSNRALHFTPQSLPVTAGKATSISDPCALPTEIACAKAESGQVERLSESLQHTEASPYGTTAASHVLNSAQAPPPPATPLSPVAPCVLEPLTKEDDERPSPGASVAPPPSGQVPGLHPPSPLHAAEPLPASPSACTLGAWVPPPPQSPALPGMKRKWEAGGECSTPAGQLRAEDEKMFSDLKKRIAESGKKVAGRTPLPYSLFTREEPPLAEQPRSRSPSFASAQESIPSPPRPAPSNIVTSITSFVSLLNRPAPPPPPAAGRHVGRIRALEAAEVARIQEEKRQTERKERRAKAAPRTPTLAPAPGGGRGGGGSPGGVVAKVKRALTVKSRLEEEKAKRLEEDMRRKEEEWRKKEAEVQGRKRQREESEKKEREEKRRRADEVVRARRGEAEKQRAELEERERKRRLQEEAEKERRAAEEDAKKLKRAEREKEMERRRQEEVALKVSKALEKEAERKRKEELFHKRKEWEEEERKRVEEERRARLQSRLSMSCTSTAATPPKGSSSLFSFHPQGMPVLMAAGGACSSSGVGGVPATGPAVVFPQTYEISPYRNGSDSDTEEEEEEEEEEGGHGLKPIPAWAKGAELQEAVGSQQRVDPDSIFQPVKTLALEEVFGTRGSKRFPTFRKRSSSGNWIADRLTWQEQLAYKKSLGFL